MCHHRGKRPDWQRDRADEAADDEEESGETRDLPSFLQESGEDVDVLTDGGDGES